MNPSSAHRSPAIESILVRGVNWLGDAIMTTPALQQLRRAHPTARIGLLTPDKLADLWRGSPWLDEVITFSPSDKIWSTARRLRDKSFQTALILPNSIRSALEVWLAGVPRRIGYSSAGRAFFLSERVIRPSGVRLMRKRSLAQIQSLIQTNPATARLTYPRAAHQMFDYLHLAAVLGALEEPIAPSLTVLPEEVAQVVQRLELPDPKHRLLLALNPGAEYGPAKRWPKERFIDAAREVYLQTGGCWVVLGGPGDRALAAQITQELNRTSTIGGCGIAAKPVAINLAGKTSLRELCAVLKACRLLLTNDTGPMHLAAALDVTVVVPFGSTSPELTGPGLPGEPRHQLLLAPVPCAPCFLRECPIDFRCMRAIKVSRVVAAVNLVLAHRRH
jgi:heptosyltransferase II